MSGLSSAAAGGLFAERIYIEPRSGEMSERGVAAGLFAERIYIEPRSGEMSERSERRFASE